MNEGKKSALKDLVWIGKIFLLIVAVFTALWFTNERWFDIAIGGTLYFLFIYSPFIFALALLGFLLRSRKKGKERTQKEISD